MNVLRISLVAVIAALAMGTSAVANAAPRSALQADADHLLDYGMPGVLIEADTPGHTVKVRSGFGNLTTGTPVPMDAEFRIGSLTKTFVATTLLQLVGEGRLSLDDTVGHWLPGVVTGNGNDGNKITVRQLLQHTSGVPDFTAKLTLYDSQQEYQRDRFATTTPERLVAEAMTMPPTSAPGTEWLYSNTNYVLVGMIIQRVTGHGWRGEVRARVLDRLGLRHTFTPGESAFIPGPHAEGYERFWSDQPADVTLVSGSRFDAAGEMISTTADINRFLRALVRGELLRPAQLAAMETTVPATEFNDRAPGLRDGLGLFWLPNSCGGEWTHPGDIPGFATREGVTPDGSRSVTMSVNATISSWQPKPGLPPLVEDPTNAVVDHALCH